MKRPLTIALIGVLTSSVSAATEAQPEIIQTLSEFHRPESVCFSLDGRTLFVANCGSDVFGPDQSFVGFVRGDGAISKLFVDRKGHVTIDDLTFVQGLNSPLGMAILPMATERFPKGTLLVNNGIALSVDKHGEPITAAGKLGTGILLFDPESGARLGRINLGQGSNVADAIGHATLLPNSLAFDSDGNLFVTDTGFGGDRLIPPVAANPGLIRIPHALIDEVAGGANAEGVTHISIPGVPNGVGYWEAEDAICVVTMGGTAPEGTAIYKLPAGGFPLRKLPVPLRGDVGRADGIVFTPSGTIITSRFTGDLLAVPHNGDPKPLEIPALTAPADHRMQVLRDGSMILAVPEQDRKDPRPWSQNVRIIRLPKGF